jgi:electron transfer flavoprotein alpha subunit
MTRILLCGEHEGGHPTRATLQSLSAALQLGGETHLLLSGEGCARAGEEAARQAGLAKILIAPTEAVLMPEDRAALVLWLAPNYTHILTPATTEGKDFLPRLAALLEVTQISEVTRILAPDSFEHSIYAGNVRETLRSGEAIILCTIRPSAFAPATGEQAPCPVETVPLPASSHLSRFISLDAKASGRPDLASARIVVSGGRGVGSKENFALIEALADKLNAAVGASRAAVDAGYIGNEHQVGQTGKIVAPDLYLAIGISGAIQHLAGMKDSRTIIAVNKDENAPIYGVSDYSFTGDLHQILPRLLALLSA